MGKHNALPGTKRVLACTLSTHCEDNTRRLPDQVIQRLVQHT